MIERHFPHFAMVAEEQHFQRAADRLHLTQSALSRRIQLLEQELGFKLFDRTARGARLTPAGEALYQDVRRIQHEIHLAVEHARHVQHGEFGKLRLAINPSAASSMTVIRMLEQFRASAPRVDLQIKMMYSEEQVGALVAGLIDVGVLYRFRESRALAYDLIHRDRLMLILPSTHKLADAACLTIRDLEAVSFVWPRRSHSPQLSDWMIAACQRAGFVPKIAMEVQSVESVVNLIGIGLGAGFVMGHQAEDLPDTVVARSIDGLDLTVDLCIARLSDVALPSLDLLRHSATAAAEPSD